LKKIIACPSFRYPNAQEFEIVEDKGIEYDRDSKKAKGGLLIKATMLEKFELRNFPFDVQHFGIKIECVDGLDEFRFFPRTKERKRSVSEIPKAADNDKKK